MLKQKFIPALLLRWTIAFAAIFMLISNSISFAADPIVSNASFVQRKGTKIVDVSYDVADADGDSLKISAEVSTNSAITFDVVASSFSGDYGFGVMPGTAKKFFWDAGADLDGIYTTGLRIRIIADDDAVPEGMCKIPAGSFSMGDHYNAGDGDELPVHDVYIDAFFMDKYEVSKVKWDEVYSWAVTNGYSFDNSGSGTSTNFPVHTVSWYDCIKWCNARSEKEGLNPVYFTTSGKTVVYKTGQINVGNDAINWSGNGYRLPTEAEWEKAARGGLSSNYFPWASSGGSYGSHIDGSKANYWDSGDPWDNATTPCGYYDGNQTPAGTDMANGYGLYDMAGNVWEWNNDWYGSSWYSQAGATNANTRGPTSGSDRVLRGGGWDLSAIYSRCAFRDNLTPAYSGSSIGFRCVRF